MELENNVFTSYPNSHSTSIQGGKELDFMGFNTNGCSGSEEKIIQESDTEAIYVTRTTRVTVV